MAKDILYPLRRLHGRICDFRTIAWPYLKKRIQNPNAVFLVMTPEHGNLGDHAITKAETTMLEQLNIPYIEITGKELDHLYYTKWLSVMNGRPILINGGGNLGTLWFFVEKVSRNIIQSNPRSTIYILPNTIFYEDSDWGKEEFDRSKKIYNTHKRLRIFAREKSSYEAMLGHYRDVKLVPDMVLSLNYSNDAQQRKGCILSLRSDCERSRSDEEHQEILRQVTALFGDNLGFADMVLNHSVPISQRNEELELQLERFRRAELVVTDRLHGMIFCTITGTPCIVLDSKSPKVRGCYDWIKHLDYIRFADNPEQIIKIYQSIPAGPHLYDNTNLMHYYDSLRDDLKSLHR